MLSLDTGMRQMQRRSIIQAPASLEASQEKNAGFSVEATGESSTFSVPSIPVTEQEGEDGGGERGEVRQGRRRPCVTGQQPEPQPTVQRKRLSSPHSVQVSAPLGISRGPAGEAGS